MKGGDISEVIRIAFVVIAFLVSVATKLAKKKNAPTKPLAPGQESDQARRVREDILRKIAERKAGAAPAAAPARTAPPPLRRLASPTAAPRPVSDPLDNPLKQILQERIRRKEAEEARRRAEVQDLADEVATQTSLVVAEPVAVIAPPKRTKRFLEETEEARGITAAGLAEDLADPDELRRAFVLNEILSRPLALR